jgi:hypothetical protein
MPYMATGMESANAEHRDRASCGSTNNQEEEYEEEEVVNVVAASKQWQQ